MVQRDFSAVLEFNPSSVNHLLIYNILSSIVLVSYPCGDEYHATGCDCATSRNRVEPKLPVRKQKGQSKFSLWCGKLSRLRRELESDLHERTL